MNAASYPTEIIQSILAPALMISASGLIFLALVNRYAAVNNRIRLLNEERRRLLKASTEKKELEYLEVIRLRSIQKQLDAFLTRGKMLRDALLFLIVGVIFFIVSSLGIAAVLLAPAEVSAPIPLLIFLLGMVSLLLGVIIAAIEIHRSFTNILVEVRAEE